MKKLVFGIITAASIGFFGLSNAAVNDHINADTAIYFGDDSIRKDTIRCTNPSNMLKNNLDGTEKTAVNPKDLPAPIKETLSGEKFKEWKTTAATFVKPTKGHAYYEIALLKDENKTLAKMKSNGKVL
ncbi:hypothetical protein [Olivibacter sitiensis]|uniref:hypothetical protein n=1 Tax=Olivibacter sitiensis TaxID=376470 RepID=UPI000417F4AF|nr:hypothetical protein [Olivibacter sitiensis]